MYGSIVGVINYDKAPHIGDCAAVFETMFTATPTNNVSATGVFSVSSDKPIQVYKDSVLTETMLKSEGYNKVISGLKKDASSFNCLVGHTRCGLEGTELNNDNNQPIITDEIVGVHNGSIHNSSNITYKFKLKNRGTTDSEVIFKLVEKNAKESESLVDAIRKADKNFYGLNNWCFVHTQYPNYLMVIKTRMDDTLVMGKIPSRKLIVIGPKTVLEALKTFKIEEIPSDGKGFIIDMINGKVEPFKLNDY